MSDCALLREFHVVKLPFGCHFGLVGEVDVDGSVSLDINLAKVQLIKSVVVLREEISQNYHFGSH